MDAFIYLLTCKYFSNNIETYLGFFAVVLLLSDCVAGDAVSGDLRLFVAVGVTTGVVVALSRDPNDFT